MKFESKHLIVLLLFLLLFIAIGTWWYDRPFYKRTNYGFVKVYNVKHRSDFNAEFVIISSVNNRLIIEIIYGPGEDNVESLIDMKANQFLIKHNFSTDGG